MSKPFFALSLLLLLEMQLFSGYPIVPDSRSASLINENDDSIRFKVLNSSAMVSSSGLLLVYVNREWLPVCYLPPNYQYRDLENLVEYVGYPQTITAQFICQRMGYEPKFMDTGIVSAVKESKGYKFASKYSIKKTVLGLSCTSISDCVYMVGKCAYGYNTNPSSYYYYYYYYGFAVIQCKECINRHEGHCHCPAGYSFNESSHTCETERVQPTSPPVIEMKADISLAMISVSWVVIFVSLIRKCCRAERHELRLERTRLISD